jgi:hypothetical protein
VAIYSLAIRLAGTATQDIAAWELVAAAERLLVFEVGVNPAAAGADKVFGLGRTAAPGVSPATTFALLPEDPASPAGTALVIQTWNTVGPTKPAQFFRRWTAGTSSSLSLHSYVWRFPEGLLVPANSSIALWHLGTSQSATVEVWVVIDE